MEFYRTRDLHVFRWFNRIGSSPRGEACGQARPTFFLHRWEDVPNPLRVMSGGQGIFEITSNGERVGPYGERSRLGSEGLA